MKKSNEYLLYDLVTSTLYKFENKTQLNIQISCFKDDYTNVVITQTGDKTFEVVYDM